MPDSSHRLADGDFEARVRSSFARQKAMVTIGAELTRVGPGTVEIELPYDGKLTQQPGLLHAGVLSTALDSACGHAAFSLIPAAPGALTTEFTAHLPPPAQGVPFLL